MKLPSRDTSGEVIPHDHTEIAETDTIIRRIDPENHVVPDENRGCRRLSSKAYKPSSMPNGGMSIDIEKLIVQGGHNPQTFVTTPKFTGSVAFTAAAIRSAGLRVGYDPIPGNDCHGEVWGPKDKPNRFSNGQIKSLREAATWYVQIPDVELL